MIVKLDNNVKVSVHWNDNAYEAECSECGRVVYGKTPTLIKGQIEQHAC